MVEERAVAGTVRDVRRALAVAQAQLATAAVGYADARRAEDTRDPRFGRDGAGRVRARPGEFAGDELAALLCDSPWAVRGLLARSRRVRSGLPTVWAAHLAGDLDTDQVRVVDRAARRASEPATAAEIDRRAVDAARTRSPQQLASWLLRLVVECEPLAFAERHRRALKDRRVTVTQGPDGMGYVTGELSAADTAQIDATLTALARNLRPEDERTEQQRRADLMADLLLGRLELVSRDGDSDDDNASTEPCPAEETADECGERDDQSAEWVEVEEIDPDTGELLGTHVEAVDRDGASLDLPHRSPSVLGSAGGHVSQFLAGCATTTKRLASSTSSPVARYDLPPSPGQSLRGSPLAVGQGFERHGLGTRRRRRTLRMGIVVPLSSLLGLSDTAGELTDRSSVVPAEAIAQAVAGALGNDDEVLLTRLLTDDGGRLLNTTELGRHPSRRLAEAIALRAGTCRHPTCTIPADRCDLDHHEPAPRGPTSGRNLDPLCRRHHRGKTFAWLATVRDQDAVDWTMPYAETYHCLDDPLPTGPSAA